MAVVADDLGAWLFALLADAAGKSLTSVVLGSDQKRALRRAARAAIKLTAGELRPESSQQADHLAMVVSEVFQAPVPEAPPSGQTMLEALQAAIAGQLAPLADPGLTGTRQSSLEALGVPAAALAEKLTGHLVREIVVRGTRGGPLEPLAGQLNHDVTHLQGQRVEGMLQHLTDIVLEVSRREVSRREDPRRPPGGRQKCVLVIGAANEEYILSVPAGWEVGQKYTAEPHSLLGGSGVNYTLRLLHYGECLAIPIVPAGDDFLGHQIQEKILEDLEDSALEKRDKEVCAAWVDSEQFFFPDLSTQRSTILVGGEGRTIFTEQRDADEIRPFTRHFLDKRPGRRPGRLTSLTRRLDDAQVDVVGVVIGHILSDSREVSGQQAGEGSKDPAGSCTKAIIDRYENSGAFIFANPGFSQIRLGKDFWEKDFEKLDVLQLNLNEIKLLFNQDPAVDTPLLEIVDWLATRGITTVITLDKLGAICVCCTPREDMDKGKEADIVIAMPLQITGIEDTTGAGDAFGAAIVNRLFRRQAKDAMATPRTLTGEEWGKLLGEARYWAAYACTTLGGAEGCPSKKELEDRKEEIQEEMERMGRMGWRLSRVDVMTKNAAESLLVLLDRAYSSVQN